MNLSACLARRKITKSLDNLTDKKEIGGMKKTCTHSKIMCKTTTERKERYCMRLLNEDLNNQFSMK